MKIKFINDDYPLALAQGKPLFRPVQTRSEQVRSKCDMNMYNSNSIRYVQVSHGEFLHNMCESNHKGLSAFAT